MDEGTRDRILHLLKVAGPRTASQLAARLGVTSSAARQHLARLEQAGWIAARETPGKVGRPAKLWHLLAPSRTAFPEGHSGLALELFEGAREAFGEEGLEELLRRRTARQLAAYSRRLPGPDRPLDERVRALARIRRGEGYMARVTRSRGRLLLHEHHCPISAAACACPGLCSEELELFRRVLGPEARVERTEHLLAAGRRCTYEIAGRDGP